MGDNKAFLEGILGTADTAIKAGNMAMLNRVAVNPAVKHYYDNVFKLKSITHEQWERDYPHYVAMVDELREAYDLAAEDRTRVIEQEARVKAIEAAVAKLTESIEKMTAATLGATKATKKLKTETEDLPNLDETPEE